MRGIDSRLSVIEKITNQKLAAIHKRTINYLNSSPTSEEQDRIVHIHEDVEASQKEPINLNTLVMDWVIESKWCKAYEVSATQYHKMLKTTIPKSKGNWIYQRPRPAFCTRSASKG
jgi:hypothetical protein